MTQRLVCFASLWHKERAEAVLTHRPALTAREAPRMADKLIRTYRFKLKPTAAQHNRLREALEHSRLLYNAALEERIDCYRKTGKGLSFMDQCLSLTHLRECADYARFPAVMQRGALRNVDKAYAAFFRRSGFPRFKSRDRFKCLNWPQANGFRFDGRFHCKGIGAVRVQRGRALPSAPLSCRIKREGRHWYLSLCCEISAATSENVLAIGIDLGLSTFAALSDGTLVPNPRHARNAQRDLRRRQRALSRCKRGSAGRRKARERVVKAHLAIRRARRTHHFQVAADLCHHFGLIAVEDLNIKNMARGMLARDVNDAAWGSFLQILRDKAESAGVQVVAVDPRGTSQECPECGNVQAKKLSERVHSCPCGFEADRDVASARVILNRAVHGPAEAKLAVAPVSPRKVAA